MTDPSLKLAGYALRVDYNPDQKIQSKRNVRTRCVCIKSLLPRTAQEANLVKRSFGNLHGILSVRTHSVTNIKTDDCLNGIKSVTRFFQTKAIPPSLWNACDYVLQFNLKRAHIAGSVNTAGNFSPDKIWKSRRRSISRSGRVYKQHP